MDRMHLIKGVEEIFANFNMKQHSNPTIRTCFHKVGQDIFSDNLDEFHAWLESLSTKALYKSLVEAHKTAIECENAPDAIEFHLEAAIREEEEAVARNQ